MDANEQRTDCDRYASHDARSLRVRQDKAGSEDRCFGKGCFTGGGQERNVTHLPFRTHHTLPIEMNYRPRLTK